jgi:hypothetical protein
MEHIAGWAGFRDAKDRAVRRWFERMASALARFFRLFSASLAVAETRPATAGKLRGHRQTGPLGLKSS